MNKIIKIGGISILLFVILMLIISVAITFISPTNEYNEQTKLCFDKLTLKYEIYLDYSGKALFDDAYKAQIIFINKFKECEVLYNQSDDDILDTLHNIILPYYNILSDEVFLEFSENMANYQVCSDESLIKAKYIEDAELLGEEVTFEDINTYLIKLKECKTYGVATYKTLVENPSIIKTYNLGEIENLIKQLNTLLVEEINIYQDKVDFYNEYGVLLLI